MVDAAFYYGMDIIFSKMTITVSGDGGTPRVAELIERISLLQNHLRVYFVPVSAGIFLFFGIILWLYLKALFKKLVMQAASGKDKEKAASADREAEEKNRKEQYDHRLFLHLLSVLQREGRLIDFFSENLDLHEDSQIGAAVRNIHENCKKAIKKYFSLKAVIDQNEGDEVTVEPGFDPGAIKLTGNVTGEPPFKGILRHRGWQVAKIELPKLSITGRQKTFHPAEVEIME
jgi:hypothetical protein